MKPQRCVGRDAGYRVVAGGGEDRIACHGAYRVGDGIESLPDEVAQQHRCAVACHAAPRTGHVAVVRDAPDVDGKQHDAAGQREQGAIDGAVRQLVPEREVEVDAHHNLCHHDDGDDAQSLPVVGANHVAEHGQPAHHAEKSQQREDDEVPHAQGIVFRLVGILRLGKDDGLVGVAEGLRYHCHNHRHLRAAAVHAQLDVGLCLVGVDLREDDLVGHLIQDAHHAQQEYGPRVGDHAAQQAAVHMPVYPQQVGNEEEGDEPRAEQVDEEDVEHGRLAEEDEEDHVERDAEHDEQQLERGEPYGAVLEAQVAEGQCLQGIQGDHRGHDEQVFGMRGVAREARNGGGEAEDEQEQQRREAADDGKAGGEDRVGLFALVVGEAEQRGLHAERQDDEHQGRVGVHVCAHAIVARSLRHVVRVEGNEQVVEETPHDARQSVYGRILGQSFQVCHLTFTIYYLPFAVYLWAAANCSLFTLHF